MRRTSPGLPRTIEDGDPLASTLCNMLSTRMLVYFLRLVLLHALFLDVPCVLLLGFALCLGIALFYKGGILLVLA